MVPAGRGAIRIVGESALFGSDSASTLERSSWNTAIRAWLTEYNTQRPKKILGGLTPAAYARQQNHAMPARRIRGRCRYGFTQGTCSGSHAGVSRDAASPMPRRLRPGKAARGNQRLRNPAGAAILWPHPWVVADAVQLFFVGQKCRSRYGLRLAKIGVYLRQVSCRLSGLALDLFKRGTHSLGEKIPRLQAVNNFLILGRRTVDIKELERAVTEATPGEGQRAKGGSLKVHGLDEKETFEGFFTRTGKAAGPRE